MNVWNNAGDVQSNQKCTQYVCVCVSIVKSVFVVSFELDTHTEDYNSDNDNDITSKVVPILFCWGIVYGIDLVHQST